MFSKAGLIVASFFVALMVSPAQAEKRVALVIGNSGYKSVPRLPNPSSDAEAIAKLFKDASFDVVEHKTDLTNSDMRRTLRDFSFKTRDADFAVVYFAGHGIEIDGANYLIPVDAILEQDGDAYDEAIALDRVLQTIEPSKKLRLVILDACRDNPFARTIKRTAATRSLGRGLAGVEPGKPNTLIAFAAKGGSTAEDGAGKNSPFTSALLNHITRPGVDLRKALGLVRDEVMSSTGGKQEPFVYGSLGGNDVSLVPPEQQHVNPSADKSIISNVRADYDAALQVNTKHGWTSFLSLYSTGLYADLARERLRKLAADEESRAASEAAKKADEDRKRLAERGATKQELKSASETVAKLESKKREADRLSRSALKGIAAAERRVTQGPVTARVHIASRPELVSTKNRSCSSTNQECVRMSTPYGESYVAACSGYYRKCLQTGEWNSWRRTYTGLAKR